MSGGVSYTEIYLVGDEALPALPVGVLEKTSFAWVPQSLPLSSALQLRRVLK